MPDKPTTYGSTAAAKLPPLNVVQVDMVIRALAVASEQAKHSAEAAPTPQRRQTHQGRADVYLCIGRMFAFPDKPEQW